MPNFETLRELGDWLVEQECGDSSMLLVFYDRDDLHGRCIVHGDGPTIIQASAPFSLVGCITIRPAPIPDLPVEVTFGCFKGTEEKFLHRAEQGIRDRLRKNQPPVREVIRKYHTSLPIVGFYRFQTADRTYHDVLLHLANFKPWQAAAIITDAIKEIRAVSVRPRRGLIEPQLTERDYRMN